MPSEPFIPNEHQVSVGKIFGVLGAVFGIALCIGAKLWVKRLRKRRAENADPPAVKGFKIPLLKISLPELDTLPLAERERILKELLESPEMKRFRLRAQLAIKVLAVLFTASILAIGYFAHAMSSWLLLFYPTFVIVIFVALALARVQLEVKILKGILRRKVGSK